MHYIEELKTLIYAFMDWLILMGVFTLFFFTFNVGVVTMFGRSVLFVHPTMTSFATEIFRFMVEDLAPVNVPLIVTEPLAAFAAQAQIAVLLALIFTLPFLLYRLIRYLSPALYRRERWALYRTIAPVTVLFASGVAFAYVAVIPSTLNILYTYTGPIQVMPMLTVSKFIGVSMALMLATGTAFTLPVGMVLLSTFHIVPARVWWGSWRYAVVSFLVVSAIITPDGSGISMMLLSVPTAALYTLGATISSRVERRAGYSTAPHVGSFVK